MEKNAENKIWLSPPHMCGKEMEFISDAFASNWIAPMGPYVDGFEKDISAYLKTPYCVALSSGTAALHLALIMLNIKEDDYVICPSFTFSASANPVLYQKGIPVFVDSETDTWNMDPELLRDSIQFCLSKNKKPKAIILVHLYGMPAKLDEIFSIANEFEIPVLEDAAESLGSTYHNKPAGTTGLMGILSFNGNKIITTSGGGALISNDANYTKQAKFLATQARDAAPHYQHSQVGYNYRLSNICAAIGRGQMTVIDERVNQRRKNYQFYKNTLSAFEGVKFTEEPSGHFSNRWLSTCLIDEKKSGATPQKIMLALENRNIESRPLWKPLHLQPIFEKYPSFLNGNCAALFSQGICLPSGSNLTTPELERICSIFIQTLKEK